MSTIIYFDQFAEQDSISGPVDNFQHLFDAASHPWIALFQFLENETSQFPHFLGRREKSTVTSR
jgi:hypothetical protein